MDKRQFLLGSLSSIALPIWAQDIWGEKAGYPTGWGPLGSMQRWEGYKEYHVGNFSGGLEKMFAHQVLKASPKPSNLIEAKRKVKASLFMDASDYANAYNLTGLLIARGNEIWHEQYRFNRTADMRFFGWSMTKSIVGLLAGIALQEGLFTSVDDPIEKYVNSLQGHPFAGITLRNLLNMTSGINICEAYCNPNTGFERYGYSQIGYSPKRTEGTDQIKGLMQFQWGRNQVQGTSFNYTDICPVMVAWALESVYAKPLANIAEQKLWHPLGANDDATWLTDSKGFTFSGAGFSATLRDWARIGLLVAQNGIIDGRQIVPKSWLDATSRHEDIEGAVRFNVARPQRGYKNFFWHHSRDGQMLRMAGNHAQNILIDKKSGTTLVQTSVGYANNADEMLFTLFKSACEI
jgi:CubicO group peptidase (beta-lactamase class C family)